MAAYDSTAWATSVRQRARAPTTTAPGYTDADLFRVGSEELIGVIALKLIRAGEEYFNAVKDVSFVAGTVGYSLPSRAVLRKLRALFRLDSTNKTFGLHKIDVAALPGRDLVTQGTPLNHYFEGSNTVKVWPPPDSSSGTLRMTYWRRPNRLVAATTGASGAVGVVSSKTATTITLAAAPPTSTFIVGASLDLIQSTEPFESLADDQVITVVSTNTLSFASVPSTLAAGDYVCLAGEAPVFQLPVEFFGVLAQRVANDLMRGGTDPQALRDGLAELERLEAEVFSSVEERNDGAPDIADNEVWP